MPRLIRPKVTTGELFHIDTGCEELKVTISGFPGDGAKPIELIARLGKSGGCTNCLNEAMGRLISIGLQWGVPLSEYGDTLRGLQCDNPKPFPKDDKCLSCPDGVSIAIRRYLDAYKEDT